MAGMLLVSSKMHGGEQERGRRSEWDEGVTHESAAAPTMARREAPSTQTYTTLCEKSHFLEKISACGGLPNSKAPPDKYLRKKGRTVSH